MFSQVVKKYRKNQRMSLRAFGEAIGVSYQTVANWEEGTKPSRVYLVLLSLKCKDWRRDFAFELLAILQPELYSECVDEDVAKR